MVPKDLVRRKKQLKYQKHGSNRGGKPTAPQESQQQVDVATKDEISTLNQQQTQQSLSERKTRIKRRQQRAGGYKEGLVKKLSTKLNHQVRESKDLDPAPPTAVEDDDDDDEPPPGPPLEPPPEFSDDEYQHFDIHRSKDVDVVSSDEDGNDEYYYGANQIYDDEGSDIEEYDPYSSNDMYVSATPPHETALANTSTESLQVDDNHVDSHVVELLYQREEADESTSEVFEQALTTGWDTRNVLDDPPQPAKVDDAWDNNVRASYVDYEENKSNDEMTNSATDGWDTTKVIVFGHARETTSKQDGAADFFDTSSTVTSEVAFSEVSLSRVKQMVLDEVKQRRKLDPPALFAHEAITEDVVLMKSVSLEAYSALVSEVSFLGVEQNFVNGKASTLTDHVKELPPPSIYESLLAQEETRSDIVFDDAVDKVHDNKDSISQKDRIDNYLKTNEDYMSSDDENALRQQGVESEEEEADDDNVDVQYVLHDANSNEQELNEAPTVVLKQEEDTGLYAYTSFEPATLAAVAAGESTLDEGIEVVHSPAEVYSSRPKVEMENLDMLNISEDHSMFEFSLESSVWGNSLLAGSSLAGSSILSRKTAKSPSQQEGGSGKKTLPLIKPPPEEKLKKWEQQKLRPFKHLEAMKKESNGVPLVDDTIYPVRVKLGLDDKDSAVYAKMTVGAITERQSGSVNKNSAKAKWKVSRRETDAHLSESNYQSEPEGIDPLSIASTETPIETVGLIERISDSISGFLEGSPEFLRDPLRDRPSSSQQQQEFSLSGSAKLDEVTDVNGKSASSALPSFALSEAKFSSPLLTNPDTVNNSKIAAQTAVLSSQAMRTFEERFMMEKAAISAKDKEIAESVPIKVVSDSDGMAAGSTSFFSCGAGANFLDVSGFDNPIETVPDNELFGHISSTTSKFFPGRKVVAGVNFADYPVGDKSHNTGVDLIGGAFSPWKNASYAQTAQSTRVDSMIDEDVDSKAVKAAAIATGSTVEDAHSLCESDLILWLQQDVFEISGKESHVIPEEEPTLESILREKGKLAILCEFVAERINKTINSGMNTYHRSELTVPNSEQMTVSTLSPPETSRGSASVLAANFVSFLQRVSKFTGVMSPFSDENPFLLDIIGSSLILKGETVCSSEFPVTIQDKVFSHEQGKPVQIVSFFYVASESALQMLGSQSKAVEVNTPATRNRSVAFPDVNEPTIKPMSPRRYHTAPEVSPGPFETTFWSMPSVVLISLGFLGDPVVVCRMKMVNQYCSRIITENEHTVMRDAVRLGGMSMNVRPAFWMWITLEKAVKTKIPSVRPPSTQDNIIDTIHHPPSAGMSLSELEKLGRLGKWHHVIGRDVARAFGNMPPHKTGARFRADSIVRALITWGQGRVMKRGVKGGGEEAPTPALDGRRQRVRPRQSMAPPPWEVGDNNSKNSDESQAPTETVSDWGGVSPVGSFSSSIGEDHAQKIARQNSNLDKSNSPERRRRSRAVEEFALSGNALTSDMKQGLQTQLGFILHALAAAHPDVGYCQGMDYVVAHLLRVLQDTVRWCAVKGTLPSVINGTEKVPHVNVLDSSQIDNKTVDDSLVVEETVFRVMDCFFTLYNLRHMYWPELRCLKTCCLVFERLIQLKLPVLADHFEHHELNVGLFALGWFQTLFLYLPSMPSATVCHMWDIWLVERSFKIFFRVGTAILFLSQPLLLNHDMEGMMTYLNTFPDATLLNPDILIACALQIKVTNKMLVEIEKEVTGGI